MLPQLVEWALHDPHVRLPAWVPLHKNRTQVSHTLLRLLPSSINWYWCKLAAEQTFQVMQWARVHGLAGSAGVWPRATETEISAVLVARKDFSFLAHQVGLNAMRTDQEDE